MSLILDLLDIWFVQISALFLSSLHHNLFLIHNKQLTPYYLSCYTYSLEIIQNV